MAQTMLLTSQETHNTIMGMLMRRHRLEHLKTKEAEDAVAEALLEAKLKEAEISAPPKKQPKKNEG